MFLGHFGLALGAKRWGSQISLGVLIFATQWADLLWPLLVLSGMEHVAIEPGITAVTPLNFIQYPWSHSLLLGLIWGGLFGGIYYVWKRQPREAMLVGALVPSHWLLDVIVHRPDLPIWPGGPLMGFGLWNSLPGALMVEFGGFFLGSWLYLATTDSENRIGTWGAYGLILLLVIVYLGTTFGPTPSDATTVAVGALPLWLVVAMGWWIDRHRNPSRRD